MGPARVVPVPAQLGGRLGHDYQVAQAFGDVLVAARTEVLLPGLIGLDFSDLQLFGGQMLIHRCAAGERVRAGPQRKWCRTGGRPGPWTRCPPLPHWLSRIGVSTYPILTLELRLLIMLTRGGVNKPRSHTGDTG